MDALQGVINPVDPAFRRLAGRARPSYKKNFNASEAERDGKVLDVSNPDECWPSTRSIIGTWERLKRIQHGGLTPREAAGCLSREGHGALVYGSSQKKLSKYTIAEIDGLETAITSQISSCEEGARCLAGYSEFPNEVVSADPQAPVFPVEAYSRLNDEKGLGDGSYFRGRCNEPWRGDVEKLHWPIEQLRRLNLSIGLDKLTQPVRKLKKTTVSRNTPFDAWEVDINEMYQSGEIEAICSTELIPEDCCAGRIAEMPVNSQACKDRDQEIIQHSPKLSVLNPQKYELLSKIELLSIDDCARLVADVDWEYYCYPENAKVVVNAILNALTTSAEEDVPF